MRNKKLLAMVLVLSMVFGVVGCGKQTVKKEQKVVQPKTEEVIEEVLQDEITEEVEETVDVDTETQTEEHSAQNTTQKENKTENKKPTSTPSQSTQTTNKPVTSTPATAPTQTETKQCEHEYDPEFKVYTAIEHYIFGCNGCGYPLFTFEGNDAVNLPDLYSHPACYSEKLGMDCVGGGFHSECYQQGYCAICHDEIRFRQCMFTEMGKRCVKNEALGAYELVKFEGNHLAYFKACSCGENMILCGKEGYLMFTKQTCRYCGDVIHYPQK